MRRNSKNGISYEDIEKGILNEREKRGKRPDAHGNIGKLLTSLKEDNLVDIEIINHRRKGIRKRFKLNSLGQEIVKEYLDFSKSIVLCKKCHGTVRKGFIICKICKQHYHSPEYEQCYICHQKNIEKDNPTLKLLREYFGITLGDYRSMDFEPCCLKCGCEIWDQKEEYKVYLTKKDLEKDNCVGEICEECFQEYLRLENVKYFVKKANI